MKFPYKIGFLGMGNMAQALVKGWVDRKVIDPKSVFAANRTPGKLLKAQEQWGLQTCSTNEQVVDSSDIVIIAVKPQDFAAALDPLISLFRPKQIVVSLAAGIKMRDLNKKVPDVRWVKVAANTPAFIQRGVFGFFQGQSDPGVETTMTDLFSPLGRVFNCQNEDEFEALMVACSAGTGFVLELMMYFQDWIEEHGLEPEAAREMAVETFAGAALLASHQPNVELEDLQNKVISKKGITEAGLQSMRELEVERLMRVSFEKAALRNQELSRNK